MDSVSPIEQDPPKAGEKREFSSSPMALFVTALGAIFFAEFLVMIILSFLPPMGIVQEGIVDAALLSLIVIPLLYLLFFKPFCKSIERRKQTELEKSEIEALDRLKNEFILSTAHELRNPLSSVLGFSELLLSPEIHSGEADRKEYLGLIHDKSKALGRIIDDLTNLSRMASGQPLHLEKQYQEFSPVVEKTVAGYRKQYPDRLIEVQLPESVPALLFDQGRIGQVLDNLLNNAIKYSPDGSPVQVRVAVHPETVSVEVEDRGIGLTKQEIDRMFDKFYRADGAVKKATGLGLGMAIVKSYVEGHGGRVTVSSTPGVGTTVAFSLPRVEAVES